MFFGSVIAFWIFAGVKLLILIPVFLSHIVQFWQLHESFVSVKSFCLIYTNVLFYICKIDGYLKKRRPYLALGFLLFATFYICGIKNCTFFCYLRQFPKRLWGCVCVCIVMVPIFNVMFALELMSSSVWFCLMKELMLALSWTTTVRLWMVSFDSCVRQHMLELSWVKPFATVTTQYFKTSWILEYKNTFGNTRWVIFVICAAFVAYEHFFFCYVYFFLVRGMLKKKKNRICLLIKNGNEWLYMASLLASCGAMALTIIAMFLIYHFLMLGKSYPGKTSGIQGDTIGVQSEMRLHVLATCTVLAFLFCWQLSVVLLGWINRMTLVLLNLWDGILVCYYVIILYGGLVRLNRKAQIMFRHSLIVKLRKIGEGPRRSKKKKKKKKKKIRGHKKAQEDITTMTIFNHCCCVSQETSEDMRNQRFNISQSTLMKRFNMTISAISLSECEEVEAVETFYGSHIGFVALICCKSGFLMFIKHLSNELSAEHLLFTLHYMTLKYHLLQKKFV
ncbi:hypothetical protein RFI_13737, partial [Reticulomyxa filosa]